MSFHRLDRALTLRLERALAGEFREPFINLRVMFPIPMGGWRMPDGRFGEGTQLEPDIKVRNDPLVLAAGRDQQLEAAVKELMKNANLTQATP